MAFKDLAYLKRNKQHIHLKTYVHSMLNILKTTKSELTIEQLKRMTRITYKDDAMLTNALKESKKIEFKDGKFKFRFKFYIKNSEDILEILTRGESIEGVLLSDLKDSPDAIEKYIDELKAKNQIYILRDSDNSHIVFYNDLLVQPVDEEIEKMWFAEKIYQIDEMENKLREGGMTVQKEEILNIKKERGKKQNKKRRRIRITNTHMTELNLTDLH